LLLSDKKIWISVSDGDTFFVSFKPNDDIPELIVNFTLTGELNQFIHKYYYLFVLSDKNNELQSFLIESAEMLTSSSIIFKDMDFDGYLDMGVVWYKGLVNYDYQYYRYVANEQIFEKLPFFNVSYAGIEIYSDTKQIITFNRINACSYEKRMYQYFEGEYIHLRSEFLKSINLDSQEYDVRIVEYDGDIVKEIYSAIMSQEEYYGDSSTLDNYLRFGSD